MAEAVRMLGSGLLIAALVAAVVGYVLPLMSGIWRGVHEVDFFAASAWLKYFAVFGGALGLLLYGLSGVG